MIENLTNSISNSSVRFLYSLKILGVWWDKYTGDENYSVIER